MTEHPLYRQHVARHRLARSAVDKRPVLVARDDNVVDASDRFLLPPDLPDFSGEPEPPPRKGWWRRVREWCRG